MAGIQELMKSAVELERGGQLEAARRLYDEIVAREPRHPGALHALGLMALKSGQADRAIEFFRRAIAVDPSQAAVFGNLAEAHRKLRQLPQAIEAYRQAIRLAPHLLYFRNNLGVVLQDAGLLDEAVASYRQGLQIEPRNAHVHFNLGATLQQQGKLDAAAACYRQALEIEPAHLHSWINLGALFGTQKRFAEARTCYERASRLDPRDPLIPYNLGNIHQELGEIDKAIVCYRRSLALDANQPNTLCNLGNALHSQRQFAEAMELQLKALKLHAGFPTAHSNLGVTYQDLGRIDEAYYHLQEAVRLDPDTANFQYNLGTVLRDQDELDEAIRHYDQALRIEPQHAQALCARGAALLQLGRFAPGWAGYDHRVDCPEFGMRKFTEPAWDGSPLGRRRLLVYSEQGLGDTLQFIRYVRFFDEQDQLILAVQPSLIPLLEQSGYSRLASKNGPLEDFDVYVHLMSLARIHRTEVDDVPREVPYVKADEGRIARWRERLREFDGLKVGIAWQGKTEYRSDCLRSIPLAHFAPLADVPSARLLSLQKGIGSEQLAALAGRFEVVDLAAELDNEGGAFLDTVAVMKNLDLVITSDTSIAHLAGALGVPVWVALRVGADWRWMLERSDSPWYPTMRLFRQSRLGAWDDVFERIAAALGEYRPRA